MKKCLSLLVCVMLLLTMIPCVAATGADGAIVCKDVAAAPGEQVEMQVVIENNPGFMSLLVTPVIDPALTLVSVTNGTLISDLTRDGNYFWVGEGDVTEDGLLMTFTFAIAENVPYGEYKVGFEVRECAKYDEQRVTISVQTGTVTVGAAKATDIDQFGYEVDGDELIITAYIGEEAKVRIGSTYTIGGTEYTVTAIGSDAFAENAKIESVVIPETVKTIGDYAFYYCENLKSVKLNDGLQTIGSGAFSGIALTEITVPATVTGIGDDAFYDCIDMMYATVLNKNAQIGDHAFGYDFLSSRKPYVLREGFVLSGYQGSTAEAYATANGITFDVMQAPAGGTVEDALKIAAASLSLQTNLTVNYKVEKSVFAEYPLENPAISVQMNGNTVVLDTYTEDGAYYVFSFRNIAPNQMNDTITATLSATHKTTGEKYVCQAREYSIATYCYSMLAECAADKYAELRTLLVDLLNYGAASQTYTGYKTDALVNAALTEEQKAWGTSAEPAMSSVLNTTYATVENPTAKWTGAGLNLQESVALRLMFTAENVDGLSVKIESGEEVWTIPASEFVAGEGNAYTVYFNGLHAGQMRQDVYLTVYNGETAVSNTARYSIGSYAFEMKDSSIAGLADLVKAMMKYGDSAYAYAN